MAQAQTLTDDTTHRLLSEPRRRHLLSLLNEHGTMTIEGLAHRVATREYRTVDDATRQQVTVSLVHQHLPLLADHNVVQYDTDSGRVVPMDVFDELEPYLDGGSSQESVLEKLIPGK